MRTEIGRLHLQLPPGFEGRAQRLGRLVGEALAARSGLPSGRLERLKVGPLKLDPSRSDRALAGQVAAAVARAIHASTTQSES